VIDYVCYCREHRGLAEGSLARDAAEIERFLAELKRRRRNWKEVRLVDIDQFLLELTHDVAPATVARVACALRGWFRFLHATGRVQVDIASSVVAPVRPRQDRPPRAWPWGQIKKLLRGIDRTTAIGCRDRAQFLLMSACGLGAAEVLQLRLEDIDWRGQRLHIVRRKTKAPITLPLLPEVARALANYIRHCRPKPTAYRQVFLGQVMPHRSFEQSAVLRHRVRAWARRAGVEAPLLGTHLFRHSHATRQVVLGTTMKTLGDILGHRDPETTSIYARAAVQRLRRLALAVPR
jgi:site-specific recombinase XerD